MNNITTDELRRMNSGEGLILQGCGGDLKEWVDGINDMLTEAGILLDGTKFDERNVRVFTHEGLTNLLFPFDDTVKFDMGRLAMWRLQTHSQFGGTWQSDYIPNTLGGYLDITIPLKEKPDCALIGEDGNVFNLMGIASRTLKENGMAAEAKEMCGKIMECGSYDEALGIIGEYVNITSADEIADEFNEEQDGGMSFE